MQITIKQLSGGECILQILPSTSVLEIKRQIAQKLHVPVDLQKLLFLGRTLADEKTVECYPTIRDGSKLNLIVMKPEGLYEASVKYFKTQGIPEKEAIDGAQRLLKVVKAKFYKLSWDDIDRIAWQFLREEYDESPDTENNMIEYDNVEDDGLGL